MISEDLKGMVADVRLYPKGYKDDRYWSFPLELVQKVEQVMQARERVKGSR